jgi:hypothetical protein
MLSTDARLVNAPAVKEFKNVLDSIKGEVRSHRRSLSKSKKKHHRSNGANYVRNESSMLLAQDTLYEASMQIEDGKKIALDIEESAIHTMRDMKRYSETLEKASKNASDARSNLNKSNAVINRLTRRSYTNKFILGFVVIVLLVSIAVIVYYRLYLD